MAKKWLGYGPTATPPVPTPRIEQSLGLASDHTKTQGEKKTHEKKHKRLQSWRRSPHGSDSPERLLWGSARTCETLWQLDP